MVETSKNHASRRLMVQKEDLTMVNPVNDQLQEEFEECCQKAALLESELDEVRELMNAYR